MHMHGMPGSLRSASEGVDVLAEMLAFLRQRTGVARAAGIELARIVVDPGIGFAKTPAQNLEILERQDELLQLGVPVLVGWSRKATLARLAGVSATPPARRSDAQRARLDAASVAAMLLAVQRGARVVRVHNVAASVAALAVWKAAGGTRPSCRTVIRHPPL
jgi:dihydropteroate synthase